VCATHRALEDDVKSGRFRQDLFFRLNAAKLIVPPLRHRKREIAVLARRFLADACAKNGRTPPSIAPSAMQRLLVHAWPGNVRELKNAMEFVAATASEATVESWQLPESVQGVAPAEADASTGLLPSDARAFRPIDEEVRELERMRMAEALAATGGVQTKAAELISMPLRTFVAKLKQYNLSSRSTRSKS
jgi:DNA-binding NtrC family response regulator